MRTKNSKPKRNYYPYDNAMSFLEMAYRHDRQHFGRQINYDFMLSVLMKISFYNNTNCEQWAGPHWLIM